MKRLEPIVSFSREGITIHRGFYTVLITTAWNYLYWSLWCDIKLTPSYLIASPVISIGVYYLVELIWPKRKKDASR